MKQPKTVSDDVHVSEELEVDNEDQRVVSDKNNGCHKYANEVEHSNYSEVENDKGVTEKMFVDNEKEDQDKSNALLKYSKEISFSRKERNVAQMNEADPDITLPLMTAGDEILHLSDVIHSENDCKTCHEFSLEIGKTRGHKMSKTNEKDKDPLTKFEKTTSEVDADDNGITDVQDVEKDPNKKRWFSLTPLKNVGFLFFLASGFLIEVALNVPFTFLPGMMIQKGFHKQDAVWMLFIIGILWFY